MWKTPGGLSAEMSRFRHIIPLETAQTHCNTVDLASLRKLYMEVLAGEQKATAIGFLPGPWPGSTVKGSSADGMMRDNGPACVSRAVCQGLPLPWWGYRLFL